MVDMMVNIYKTSHFVRDFKKMSNEIKKQAIERIGIFCLDPFDPRLKTHKLSGDLDAQWSFAINYSIRITCVFLTSDTVSLISIGDHDDVY